MSTTQETRTELGNGHVRPPQRPGRVSIDLLNAIFDGTIAIVGQREVHNGPITYYGFEDSDDESWYYQVGPDDDGLCDRFINELHRIADKNLDLANWLMKVRDAV